jgi:hypothetical protein
VSARIALPKPMMPCSKFLFLFTIFPKNDEKFFSGPKKKGSKNFSGHSAVKLKKNFPYKFLLKMGETLIFGPISVKFRPINSIQFPLKAL